MPTSTRPRRWRRAGSYKNSGQRCTAVKRILVHETVADDFVSSDWSRKTKAWRYGDPANPTVDMGTVIDEASAQNLRGARERCLAQGARLLAGNVRDGALYAPTVLDHVRSGDERGQDGDVRTGIAGDPVPRHRRRDPHLERHRLWPVFVGVHESARLHHALRRGAGASARSTSAKFPGYRLELTPFGGIKDSGLGYKEGVQEAMKSFTNTKTYSLPW